MTDKKRFLVVDDYGTGGVWFVVLAPSEHAIRETLPSVTIYEQDSRPRWMTESELQEIASQRTFDLDDLPDSDWMRRLRGRSE